MIRLAFNKMAQNVVSQPATDLFLKVFHGHRQWVSVKAICDRLNSAGFDAVLAGGCVRDGLLGVSPKDFDVATDATPDQVESLFERTVAVGKSFGVIVIPNEFGSIEVATYRQDGTYEDGRRPTGVVFADRREDALRRDFTVNALFYDLKTTMIIDHVDGLQDLARKVLRTVGSAALRFQEDKLRILRAVRFSGQLDFEIESETKQAVTQFANELSVVSRERIRDEIDRLLQAKNAVRGFREIQELGLGPAVFQDWATLLLPPDLRVFQSNHLDVQRALLFFPALLKASPERIQERLKEWKYGRTFVEFVTWMMRNSVALRTRSEDPKHHLLSRALILQNFEAQKSDVPGQSTESRLFSEFEREWMTSLELWTDPRAPRACEVLDLVMGVDQRRDVALSRRNLRLGEADPERAKADDLKKLRGGSELAGASLGLELRRLNRELLLR